MERIKSAIKKARYSYRSLPDKKQYVEFFTALLTVPVLLTVIVLNVNNLRTTNKAQEEKKEDTRPIIITSPPTKDNLSQITPIPTTEECQDEVGPVSISYPEEGENVDENPLNIGIKHDRETYCAVVWSYRINGGRYSDYDDKSIAIYNPPNGTIIFDLRVKSLSSGDEKILKRTFTYSGSTTPTASSSAN